MSQSSIPIALFVCKWSGTHLMEQRFNTQKDLELHVNNDHEDLTKLEIFKRGRRFYICPWEGCKKQQVDIIMLKEHLLKHTMQKPFKCQTCNGSRQFESLDTLNHHSINRHNFSIIDSTGTSDMTNTTSCDDDMLYEEKEAKEQVFTKCNPVKPVTEVTNTIIPETSYAQIVKTGTTIAKVKDEVDLTEEDEVNDYFIRRYRLEEDVWALFRESLKYLGEDSDDVSEYDLDNEDPNELPDAPRNTGVEFMTEYEKDNYMWEAYCRAHKGSKVVELMNKAHELVTNFEI